MLDQKRQLFRKQSVERLSSPERLDQLMQVVSPKSWLTLASLGFLVVIAGIWSVYGRIPITVEGKGVLIYPRKVVPLQSTSSGQLMALNVKVGDVVKKGQVLGTMNQAELQKQLQQQRKYLQQRIRELQVLTPVLKAKGNVSIGQERQGLQDRLQKTQALTDLFKQRMEIRRQLFEKEGAITSDDALKAKQEYLENLEKIADLQAQLKQLDVKEAEQEKAYRENLSTVSDLQAQLKDLDSKQASQAQQDLETSNARKKEIQEVKREIGKLEQDLGKTSQIISQHSGRILEITVTPGQVVDAGTRLGNIEAENVSSKLVGITYSGSRCIMVQ